MRKLIVCSVERLTPPEGWDVDEQTVAVICESLLLEGLREPLVITPRGHIIHGVHRWAAAKKAGILQVECVVEHPSATREIHDGKVDSENFARRHLSAAELNQIRLRLIDRRSKYGESLASAIKMERGEIAPKEESPKTDPEKKSSTITPNGHVSATKIHGGNRKKKSQKTEAIEAVATATGVKPETLARTARRAEEKTKKTALKEKVAEAKSEPVDSRGTVIPDHLQARWARRQEMHDKLGTLMRSVVTVLNSEANEDGSFSGGIQGIQIAAKELAASIRINRPAIVCPWCKGAPEAKCATCSGWGFRTENEARNTPAELMQ